MDMVHAIIIAFGLAVVVIGITAWRPGPQAFRALPAASFTIGSALFWGVFAALMIAYAWSFYYVHFVPAWYRYAAPLGAAVLYPLLAHLIRWASLRLPGNPAVTFCLLGGLEAIPEHAVGIYRFRILDIPMLQGVSPGSVFLFAYFEYVVYWGVALMLVAAASRLAARLHARTRQDPRRPQTRSHLVPRRHPGGSPGSSTVPGSGASAATCLPHGPAVQSNQVRLLMPRSSARNCRAPVCRMFIPAAGSQEGEGP
jgi:hypothetical protein